MHRGDDPMKVERPPIDLALPVPARAEVHPSSLKKAPKTRSAYDSSSVIDTVEIQRNDFRPLSVSAKKPKHSGAGAGKGLYIDLWA
jgi:hypothetical protein